MDLKLTLYDPELVCRLVLIILLESSGNNAAGNLLVVSDGLVSYH